MFSETSLSTWEIGWIIVVSLFIIVPTCFLIHDKGRGIFIKAYVYIFIIHVCYSLTHAYSNVDDQAEWSDVCGTYLKVKKKKLDGSKKIYKGNRRCMYLLNHTSMADLFLSDLILEGRCNYLARYGVMLFCPLPMVSIFFMNSIWLFKRGGRGDKLEPFFKSLDANFDFCITARHHLCCFPEGHRALKPYMLPLKKGMIRYAYERELLIQPIVVFGMENAMSEYTLKMDWNNPPTMEYYASDVIDPQDYKPGSNSKIAPEERTLEAFQIKVETTLFSEFERNHQRVLPANNREKYLRDGEEKTIYNQAKVGQKSIAMNEYATERRKNKRK